MFRYCPYCQRPLTRTEVAGRLRPTCLPCGFVHFPDPKVAVGVIATKEGKLLLQQRGNDPSRGLWSFPSGYVDAGEKVEEAALREVREETGVEVRLDGHLGVYSERGNPVIFIVYMGTVVSGEPRAGRESLAVGLFPPGELPSLAFDHDQQILQDWRHAVGLEKHYPGGKE